MIEPTVITDGTDPRVAAFAAMTDRVARQRIDGQEGVFVVEGARALRQLLISPYGLRSVLVAANRLPGLAADLEATTAPVYVASPVILSAIAGFDVHRGVLALGERREDADPDAIMAAASAAGARTLLVVEGVNDHENLGALFRNAAAFGIGAVLADPTTCDPLYRRSIRVSSGYVLRVPFARLEPWPGALDHLARSGWTTVALTPGRHAESIDDVAADPPERVALLLGAEGPGLRPETLAAAARQVRIPLAAGVDSLNVATAAAIAMHRLARHPS